MRRLRSLLLLFLATALLVGGGAALHATSTSSPSYPTAASTGVPEGAKLTPYSGPSTITKCGVTIDHKVLGSQSHPFDLDILASNGTKSSWTPCVWINDSLVYGKIDDRWSSYNCGAFIGCGPVLITRSEVFNPVGRDVAAVSESNIIITGSYVHGARSGVQCDGNCWLVGNYLLADREFGAAHMDAFITNGNAGRTIVLWGNSFLCAPTGPVPNGAGCAADVGMFGDFDPVQGVIVVGNIFRATHDAYYCLHSGYEPKKPFGLGGNDLFVGNVFERGTSGKCGDAGPVYDWSNSAGVWCKNRYPDGANVLATADNCP